ncbi:MAG: ABC transporter permease subunit, partial [Candidatus Sericytochromatia bacterium]
LFLAYLYFSLPRAIAAFTAAAETLEPHIEEAARSLGARPWQLARDVWLPALAPTALAPEDGPPALVLEVTASVGEYRPGDLVWLRQVAPEDAGAAINRDCLVPRPGGRFAFGRLIDRRGSLVGLLPPGAGQKQVVVDNPPWIAVAFMLVRAL